MKMAQEKKLLNYLAQMQFTDILGIANIVGTELVQDQPFEDFIVQLIYDFTKLPRKARREMIKLCADVAGANKDLKIFQESQDKTDG